jgi:hypothetical protein
MKKTLVFLILVSFAVISCNNSTDSKESESTVNPNLQPMLPSVANEPSQTQNPNVPVSGQASNLPPGSSQPVTTGSSKLNPPHGEPGHRCDLAVGAPLDMASQATALPNSNNSMTPTITPVQNSSPSFSPTPSPQQVPPAASSSAKVNPPHGEPGHRCDLAVGAPLDLAPPAVKSSNKDSAK